MLSQFLVNGVINGCVIALLAMGFALIYYTTRIFHIAYGATFAVAAYLFYLGTARLGIHPAVAAGLVIGLSAAGGASIERFIYAPLERQRASPLVALLTSLGLYIAIVNLLALFFGNETRPLRRGAGQITEISLVILTEIQLLQAVTALTLLLFVLVLLRKTRIGSAIRAVRDDPALAHVMAIDPRSVRLFTLALGSALCAVAAILVALDSGIDPHIGLPAVLAAAVAMIIGGLGSYWGAPFGGLVLGVLQSVVAWGFSGRWVEVVTFVLLILLLLVRGRALGTGQQRLEEKAA